MPRIEKKTHFGVNSQLKKSKTKRTWICDINLERQVPNPKNKATVKVLE